jgi:protein kinase C substrate 80K-H
MENDYEVGSEKRKLHLQEFQELVERTLKELQIHDQALLEKSRELQAVEVQVQAKEAEFVEQRRKDVLTTAQKMNASDGTAGLLEALSTEELVLFLQLLCQLSGEMEGSIQEKTCVPLRLSGLDIGIVWEDEVFKDATVNLVNTQEEEGRKLWLDLVLENTKNGQKVWSKRKLNIRHNDNKRKPNRRRLDDYYHDDDYGNYNEGEFDDYDAYRDDEDEDDEPYREHVEESDPQEPEVKGEEIENIKLQVEGTLFSRPRKMFLAQAESLLDKIEAKLKEGTDDTDEHAEEQEGEEQSPKEDVEKYDAEVLQNVKDSLKKRQQSIKRGLQYGVSGQILGSAIIQQKDSSHARTDLLQLAVGMLVHSKVTSEHVWYVLTSMIPDLTFFDDSQVCASPLANRCPVKSLQRLGKSYPPTAILVAGQTACERALEDINVAGCNAVEAIPNSIPDGYYGYKEIKPRGQDDTFFGLFASFDNSESLAELKTLEDSRQTLENEKSDVERTIETLEKNIGGRDQTNANPELHGLLDECFSVTEGKYDYEVCINGKAQQKDKGAASGTSLGRWKGMSMEDGQRVMKWENGQKCWNGPERSVTVYIQCGAETQLLSAEEPDTCRYVLQMESYIACDDEFYQKYLA